MEKDFLEKEYWNQGKTLEEIGGEVGLNHRTIRYWMKKHGIPRRTPYEKKMIKPKIESSETLSYIVGVLLGDGWAGKVGKKHEYRVALQTRTLCFNRSFERALAEIGLNPRTFEYKIKGRETTFYGTFAHSKIFVGWFKSLEFEDIENLAKKYPIDFLRGFYESEGNYQETESEEKIKIGKKVRGPYVVHRVNIRIVNTNKKLIMLTKDLMKKIGFHPTTIYGVKTLAPQKPQYCIAVYKKGEAGKFISLINPIIKKIPIKYILSTIKRGE